jgi:catechol 2,3-dioxygenase-like lactoylglutathione lyase family enzyme
MPPTSQAQLSYIAPFFIVGNVLRSAAFYRDRLGFELTFLGPDRPFFAMLMRDGVGLMLKAITPEVQPTPNPSRHHWARWDAYVNTPDPDALAEEFTSRGVSFREPLGINPDQLRGFEVMDPDGYVLYFGRPVSRVPLRASCLTKEPPGRRRKSPKTRERRRVQHPKIQKCRMQNARQRQPSDILHFALTCATRSLPVSSPAPSASSLAG